MEIKPCVFRSGQRESTPYPIAECNRAAELPLFNGRPATVNLDMCRFCLEGNWVKLSADLQTHIRINGKEPDRITGKRKRLNVGFMLPGIFWGGLERWQLTTLKYLDRTKINPVGVWLENGPPTDGRLMAETKTVTTIFSSLENLTSKCDILVISGITIPPKHLDKSKRCIVVSHGEAIWTKRLMDNWANRADAFVGVSAAAIKPIIEAAGTSKPVNILPNGVDLQRVETRLDKRSARRKFGIPPDAKVLGYVGRMVKEKGVSGIVHALANLPQNWHLLMVGGGFEFSAIPVLAANLKVLPRVHMHGMTLEIGDACRAMDVFTQPSQNEGFSLSLLEAMAARLPCVATRVGAIPEIEEMLGRPIVWPVVYPATGTDMAKQILLADACEDREVFRTAAEYYSAQKSADQWTSYLLDMSEELPERVNGKPVSNSGCGACGKK